MISQIFACMKYQFSDALHIVYQLSAVIMLIIGVPPSLLLLYLIQNIHVIVVHMIVENMICLHKKTPWDLNGEKKAC